MRHVSTDYYWREISRLISRLIRFESLMNAPRLNRVQLAGDEYLSIVASLICCSKESLMTHKHEHSEI